MPIMSKPSSGPRTALTFITLGALLTIWSGVWFSRSEGASENAKTVILGLFLTGIAFLVIGFSVGYISRAARHSELPPSEAIDAVARADAHRQVAPGGVPAPAPPQAPPANAAYPPTNVYQAGPGGNP